MGLIFCDSFDHYLQTQQSAKWNVPPTNTFGGTYTRNGRSVNWDATVGILKSLKLTHSTLCAGVACNLWQNYPTNVFTILEFGVGGGTNLLRLVGTEEGKCYILAQQGSGVATSPLSTGSFHYDEWFYYELSGTCAPGVVIATAWMNEEQIATLTATFVGYAGPGVWSFVRIGPPSIQSYHWYARIDDLYVNNDGTPYGDVDVLPIYPDGPTSYSQWTPLEGTETSTQPNWQIVSSNSINTNNTVLATTTGLTDLYTMQDIQSFNGEIFGVQLVSLPRRVTSGRGRIRHILSLDTHTWVSSTHYPSAIDYHYKWDCLSTNPATGSAWTQEDVNNLKFGFERVV